MPDFHTPHLALMEALAVTILARLRTLDDLVIVAALPANAGARLAIPVTAEELFVTTSQKSGGGYRTVLEPIDPSLKRIQKRLKEFLDRQVLESHPSVHGFTRNRGSFTNASAHLAARAILVLDITDFFPSISRLQVESALQELGASELIACAIANVSTFNGTLATGFSSSPVLSNIVFRNLDIIFASYASGRNLVYTRYADDLTFSGENVTDEDLLFVRKTLEEFDFRINEKKVKFKRKGHPQVVTGYVVAHSDRPRLSKSMKKSMRQDLYYSGRIGFYAQAQHKDIEMESFKERLLGRINYAMLSEKTLAMKMLAEYKRIEAADFVSEMDSMD